MEEDDEEIEEVTLKLNPTSNYMYLLNTDDCNQTKESHHLED
jgi:hypothetical protein